MRYKVTLFLLVFWPGLLFAKSQVVASGYPLAFFLGQLVGADLEVINLTPPGVEPHQYQPGLKDLARSSGAKFLVYNSKEDEPWAFRLAQEIERAGGQSLELAQFFGTIKPPEPGHHHHGYDPHIWLDPRLSQQLAELLTQRLAKLLPQETLTPRLKQVLAKLEGLDQSYQVGLKNCQSRILVSGHDAFGYLALAYNLETLPLHDLAAESRPGLKQMAETVRLIKTKKITAVFFEEMVSPRLSETLAQEAGVPLLGLYPLGNIGSNEVSAGLSYYPLMEKNLAQLTKGLKCQKP
ncbi:MAG: hypothetical protein A2527_10950 [Candidatus Lambdaproteobacteria bacterium RIFOXYD2_FULL_50_16]|uniref:High-affinity zinc uptake system protein ZnuA n=1 Tax=Candidatus Lambdaproteobacteria bacterium RIFOXYD2_FULL_50_16 TaxID=1817772 RepID=A0A1F6G694_9PROT|nr:MAG: hypothetical protein A2527_10950 [Candidatus Lambdaproteobacteria bacterium RIFOXYD2_FULL_50_16]